MNMAELQDEWHYGHTDYQARLRDWVARQETKITPRNFVITVGNPRVFEATYVFNKILASGRPNRWHVTYIGPVFTGFGGVSHEPVLISNELPLGHARRVAEKHYLTGDGRNAL